MFTLSFKRDKYTSPTHTHAFIEMCTFEYEIGISKHFIKCFEIPISYSNVHISMNACVCVGDVYLSLLNDRVNIKNFTKEGKIGEEEVRYLFGWGYIIFVRVYTCLEINI